jgi:outer membrane protein
MARRVCAALSVVLLVAGPASAQTPPAFTLERALQYAVEHYPTVAAAVEQVRASDATVSVARAAYLPRLDSIWQSSRATVNNVTGQLFPQPVVPALSGPVLPAASSQSVWGSVAGALFSWDAVDFGLRRATVAGAEAGVTRARAAETLTRLDVEQAVANAFLAAVSAERALAAARADADRRDVLRGAVRALVENQLRPGAEASRADAERAAAQTRVILAERALTLARTHLARLLGVKDGPVAIDAADLLARLPPAALAPPPAVAHPLAQVRQAAVDQARAQEAVLARTDRPHVYLLSSVFARGSGANPDGHVDAGAGGLAFDRANWAAGIQIVLPNAFDFTSLRARRAAAAASARAERALYDEAVLTIASEQQAAAADVLAARAVAANTPVQLAAAQQTEAQARARYQAGLASIVEVADAQSLLAQAEYQDELARVDVWRAVLAESAAHGSLAPFLDLMRTAGGQ